jgi:HlyD family type I secretion membrane fusion protein
MASEPQPLEPRAQEPAPRRLQAVDDPLFHDSRRTIRAGLIVIALFFGLFGGWAVLAPLAGAIIVEGSLKVDAYRKTVQHLEGGIVKEILVKSGDKVRQGQPLIVLDDIQVNAAVESLRIQLDGALARAARLRAEKARLASVEFPPRLAARAKEPNVAALLAAERGFFAARRQNIDNQAALLRTQNKETLEEIRSLESSMKAAEQFIANSKEELVLNEKLYKDNFVAYTRVLSLQRPLMEKEEKRAEYAANISQARQKISDRELRIAALYDGYVKDATDELKDVEKQVADLEERLRPSEDQLRRQTITAPIAGEVVDMKVTTVGGVIAPREPLMDIVPAEPRVIVEGKVKVEDVDEVKVNQAVDVMLSAYSRRTTPKVAGKVTYVAGDTVTDPGPAQLPYYLVRIEIDPKSLAEAGNYTLTPGMPVNAFIRTRDRTMLRYLLEPVTDTLRKAMRES